MAKRRHRRLLGVTVASLVGLAIAVGLAIFALTQRSEAREQAKVAQSRELAASALGVLPVDPELGALVALEAAYVAPTPEAESALRDSLVASRVRTVLTGHQGAVTQAEFSPDGEQVLTVSNDGTARLFDVSAVGSPPVLTSVLEHDGPVTSGEFSADGDRILTASADGQVRVWSPSGALVDSYAHDDAVLGASFDTTGELVLSWSMDGSARLWGSPTDRVVFRHGAPVLAAALLLLEISWSPGARTARPRCSTPLQVRYLRLLEHEKPVTSVNSARRQSLGHDEQRPDCPSLATRHR